MKGSSLKIIALIFVLFGSVNSFAGDFGHSISIGVVDEFYPSSDDHFNGSAPHSVGLTLEYDYDQEKDWTNLKTYYVSFNLGFKYENDPEKYDSDRDPISSETHLNVLTPIINDGHNYLLRFVSGADINYNGPQYTDLFWMIHAGLGIEKILMTSIDSALSVSSSLAYARYFYEIDDESAEEQTGITREYLDHSGNGYLWKAKLDYNKGKNKFRFGVSVLDASDQTQNQGDFSRKEFKISWGRNVSKNTECAIGFSTVEYDYSPKALAHKDKLYSTSAKCKRRF